jgi:hypothetical protein
MWAKSGGGLSARAIIPFSCKALSRWLRIIKIKFHRGGARRSYLSVIGVSSLRHQPRVQLCADFISLAANKCANLVLLD